ncbi:DUF1254 domain-containing protein [Nocardia sp. NPDC057353]|uniref:DUF1254 domain-containing protein n=1 Tax=Nocardia sp. NPDC057353 TaxID=3346104 RepID=UPI0036270BB9
MTGTVRAGYRFDRGFPAPGAAGRAADDADLARAVLAYRAWYPTVSTEGMLAGNADMGIRTSEDMIVLTAGPRHLGFTLNSDTPYGSMLFDLTDGPMVVELPPGPFVGLVDDHHQRWVLDMGLPGPDQGHGGKHLILPPDHAGSVPPGYHVGRARTNTVLVAIRALPMDGDAAAAMRALRDVRIHRFADDAEPELANFVDVTDRDFDSTPLRWEDNLGFWERLHAAVDGEPADPALDHPYGLLAALGIERGKPFAPDDRMREILTAAARTGRDQLLVSAFASNRPDRIAWPDRQWEWVGLVAENGDFRTPAGPDLEARERWFGQAIVASPAMFRREPGAGSLYWLGLRDGTGAFLDGGGYYTLTVPGPVPAGLFWSITGYDAGTRSQIATAQQRAAVRSLFELPAQTGTEPITLFFGPQPPPEGAERWIATVPGRGWFSYFRIYGPQAGAFDGSWRLPDFQRH